MRAEQEPAETTASTQSPPVIVMELNVCVTMVLVVTVVQLPIVVEDAQVELLPQS